MATRKPFKRDGWAWTGDIEYVVLPKRPHDANEDDPIPVTVRERLPACKHEKAIKDNAPWCRECGAFRKLEGTTLSNTNDGSDHVYHWSRWRKPRRA